MDDKDIIKMILDEENRLEARREEVEAKVKVNNEKFDELVAKKGAVMLTASKIQTEEKEIQDDGIAI